MEWTVGWGYPLPSQLGGVGSVISAVWAKKKQPSEQARSSVVRIGPALMASTEARAYFGGLGAVTPAGSRDRAPGGSQEGDYFAL